MFLASCASRLRVRARRPVERGAARAGVSSATGPALTTCSTAQAAPASSSLGTQARYSSCSSQSARRARSGDQASHLSRLVTQPSQLCHRSATNRSPDARRSQGVPKRSPGRVVHRSWRGQAVAVVEQLTIDSFAGLVGQHFRLADDQTGTHDLVLGACERPGGSGLRRIPFALRFRGPVDPVSSAPDLWSGPRRTRRWDCSSSRSA
jgi:hypothetical protein